MGTGEHLGQGHRARLRDRFLEHGLEKFTDQEVLELLLTLATPRKDCKGQARALYAAFGGLRGVLDAEPGQLAAVDGVGPKNILGLKLIPAVARRYLEDRLQREEALETAAQAADYLMLTMRHLQREIFRLLALDKGRRVRLVEDLFAGTNDEAAVYPREVAARALSVGAAAVVCAHNHPSGDPRPSGADRRLTRQLYYACRGVGLELVDHVIVAENGIYSFAAQGELTGLAREYDNLGLEEWGP